PTDFRSNALIQVAVNPASGDIYAVFADRPDAGGTDNADVFFTMSTDGGTNWTPRQRVNDASGNDQWQPSLQVTPDGKRLAVGWYDRRNDPGNGLIDYFAATADCATAHALPTFRPNVRLSNQSFQPDFGHDSNLGTPLPGQRWYMGDYDGAGGAATNTE